MASVLSGRTIVLGVTGSIAAFKAADLARRLMERGAAVTPVLTQGAERFVSPVLFAGLTGRETLTDADFWRTDGRMRHLELGRADAVVVAPCSAQSLSRFAAGGADGLLAAAVLAAKCPVLLAPAMHTPMWTHPATQRNAESCRSFGYEFVGPDSGRLASGDEGEGRMADIPEILAAIERLLGTPR